MKKLLISFATTLSAFALMIGVFSVNAACVSYFHQPEIPNAMDAYRK